jgi:8-oxo-dGTP pyrophosphatase MutT (NUDIX family)
MQIHSAIVHTAPRDSATVIILRDSQSGPEVFLVRRHGLSDVLGGAYVFPGGKLDDSDLLLSGSQLDQGSAALHAALAEPALEPQRASGLFVAALREAFEECGVLFAQGADASQARALAARLQDGEPFNQALTALGLCLSASALAPWSRWITPLMPSVTTKRFDTRFFVAALPAGQSAAHDNVETTESVWLTPLAALQEYGSASIALAPPQIMTLAHLARFASVADILQAARSASPALVLPEAFDIAGERVLCYPGDARHSVAQRAMPGPTRLVYRRQRFEPEQGFGALLDLG